MQFYTHITIMMSWLPHGFNVDLHLIESSVVIFLCLSIAAGVGNLFTIMVLRSEIPSSMCAKLRTVAACNNRDHARNLSYYCLLVLHIWWCYSSRISRSWWITQSTQHHRRGCNNGLWKSWIMIIAGRLQITIDFILCYLILLQGIDASHEILSLSTCLTWNFVLMWFFTLNWEKEVPIRAIKCSCGPQVLPLHQSYLSCDINHSLKTKQDLNKDLVWLLACEESACLALLT